MYCYCCSCCCSAAAVCAGAVEFEREQRGVGSSSSLQSGWYAQISTHVRTHRSPVSSCCKKKTSKSGYCCCTMDPTTSKYKSIPDTAGYTHTTEVSLNKMEVTLHLSVPTTAAGSQECTRTHAAAPFVAATRLLCRGCLVFESSSAAR